VGVGAGAGVGVGVGLGGGVEADVHVKLDAALVPPSMAPLPEPANLKRKPTSRGIRTIPKLQQAFPNPRLLGHDSEIFLRPKRSQVAIPASQASFGASSGRSMSFAGKPLYEQYSKVTVPPCAAFPFASST
jgi:hypothetical protein